MIEVRVICRQCGKKFTATILEDGEAEHKRVRTSPVSCPRCRSTDIEKR